MICRLRHTVYLEPRDRLKPYPRRLHGQILQAGLEVVAIEARYVPEDNPLWEEFEAAGSSTWCFTSLGIIPIDSWNLERVW